MISRPPPDVRQITPAGIALALFIMMFTVLLAAGCLGNDYSPNRDIVVIKLSSNGSLEWSKIIDQGGDDKASMMIPTSDGGVIIPANYGTLIRVSKDGATVWEKNFVDSGCVMEVLAPLRDGGFVTAGGGYSAVCKFDTDGNLIWNRTSVKFDRLESSYIFSIIETDDGGFLVAGDSLSRLDPEGRLSWRQSAATDGCGRVFSVIMMSDSEDFLGLSQKNDQLYLLRLNQDGTIIANSSLTTYEVYPSPSIRAQRNGYTILFFNTTSSKMETVRLDIEGKVVDQRTLMNASIRALIASDEGYLDAAVRYIDKPWNNPAGTRTALVGLKKVDPDGIVLWTTTPAAFCKPESHPNFDVMAIVQTPDGGYAILGSRDNFWKC